MKLFIRIIHSECSQRPSMSTSTRSARQHSRPEMSMCRCLDCRLAAATGSTRRHPMHLAAACNCAHNNSTNTSTQKRHKNRVHSEHTNTHTHTKEQCNHSSLCFTQLMHIKCRTKRRRRLLNQRRSAVLHQSGFCGHRVALDCRGLWRPIDMRPLLGNCAMPFSSSVQTLTESS